MLRKCCEVLALKLELPLDPILPSLVEAQAEHAAEVREVIGFALRIAAQPLDDAFGRVGVGEIGKETCAVEVVVHANLEIDEDAFGFQADRRIEMSVVAHHGAEDHFVIRALRAAEAASHPCFHEDGAAFEMPARHVHARRREIVVEDRERLLLDRHWLAEESAPPERIAFVPHIHQRDMDDFVVGQCEEALAGAEGLVGEAQGGDVDQHRVVGRGACSGVAVVREVLQ